MSQRMSLAGKTVLITGAARGIGAELARQAAAAGARVALLGLEPDRLAALAETLGPGHSWAECDVTDQEAMTAAVESTLAAHGAIDVVVANAGIANHGTVAVTPPEAVAKVIEVNLIGVVRTVTSTLSAVTASRGHYQLISSAAAFTILPGMTPYAASKAGVEQFANGLRLELAHKGVTVGSAHPIWIDTDMTRDLKHDLGTFRQNQRRLPGPLGTEVSVEDCASALLDGIARRARKVYVPKSIAVVSALRTLVLGPLFERVLLSQARTMVPQFEAEVTASGRFFGEHSTAKI
ncbi:SDR family oxidoreductase [Cryptosporangium aurantiacum]|uniref:Short-chain dehydrogenase n=1 Tax=Cryptosporangium aurantiacum TaxID=134849 RepID=A0A1M7QY35_9ACTN|nr:SDR family oxidoreductase [Cryptosporangium aurantiacum]SHN36712.1 Short-chain dehydrogenase [Cryptosporangium aurantiacum]